MKRFVLVVLLAGIAFGQTFIGSWTVSNQKDPFTDEQQAFLSVGEEGSAIGESEGSFGILCSNGKVEMIAVDTGAYLNDGVRRPFNYRINDGEVKTVSGLTKSSFVAVQPGFGDFEPFRDRALVEGAKAAFRIESYDHSIYTFVFDLTGLDAALAAADCTR